MCIKSFKFQKHVFLWSLRESVDTDSPRERPLRLRSVLQRLREADLCRAERLDPPAACDLQVHRGGVARPLIGWFGGRGRDW